MSRDAYLISAADLTDQLNDQQTRVVDGTWLLDQTRTPRTEFLEGHIPGAVFFDVDAISDKDSSLPHMLPSPERFAELVGILGIADGDDIVVYDTAGLFSAARVWWTFKIMGARSVRILDGGLPAWRAVGGALESGEPSPAPAQFTPAFDRAAVVGLAEMKDIISTKSDNILDARPAARFRGEAPEPRQGLRSGHMPGALNLPAGEVVQDGRLIADNDLTQVMDNLGLVHDGPIVTSCGSGVTAAILTLALNVSGFDKVRLYDGSWAEWGGREDTDIV